MDGFDYSTAPPEYLEHKWLVNIFIIGMTAGWIVHYVDMAYTSFKDRTYSMTIAGLCANFAWEIVYCIIYPAKGFCEWAAFGLGLLLDLGVIYSAMKNAPNEWRQSPIVGNNMFLVFASMTVFFLTGHLALVAQLGPGLAYSWGAVLCQLLISVGDVFQLLTRGNTRGASWRLWISRFSGSTSTVAFAFIRYLYWPGSFSWLNSPLMLWSVCIFFLSEFLYGILFLSIRRYEEASQHQVKYKGK
ncbi:hypothetical protein BO70DRAFT_408363 [Aspergillus heteromorphus CBS 117.55]|uniref:Integral membrane protein n=1 Tax=Aspergillus heteromorphus CBS 117.55 TaxID=1448321 RepID=A0A317VZA8_9EURO|nr:uncharacterized protein BO70DRAFT_408363 [Aspergillus heteromorphus CBS 117.55]PWY78297.1 hypothetical protein BO70DRAFT_408363 [Aspergillus heteromorphus CBS 117.55]